MAQSIPIDVVEQILIRLEVKDLIRFKNVCKSWHSLITSPRFVNRHLDHSRNKDRHTYQHTGHRRIFLKDEFLYNCYDNYDRHGYHRHPRRLLVGSSNGLVCIVSCSSKLLVGNPLTNDVRELKYPPFFRYGELILPSSSLSLCCLSLAWGFGYDSCNDDYKVFIAVPKSKYRRYTSWVYVLSLKSKVWRVFREVKYKFISNVGILCDGALHWVGVKDERWKNVIISYDLATEEFNEIPQPDEAKYDCINKLGITKGCLCISEFGCRDIWLMRDYNVQQSWRRLRYDQEMKYDTVQFLRLSKRFTTTSNLFHPNYNSLCSGDQYTDLGWKYIFDAPVYVTSLVSPHVNAKRSRKKKITVSILVP